MNIETFFDEYTSSFSYLVWDETSKDAVVIDAVLNSNAESDSVTMLCIENIEKFVAEHALTLHYCLDTHVHADHITGAGELKKRSPQLKTVINAHVTEIQQLYKDYYHLTAMPTDGSQFDCLINDGDVLNAGTINIKAIHTPGHTKTCTCYKIGGWLFTGDTMFMPDFGTGRCDFPGGSAEDLYHSVMDKLYTLDDNTQVYVGHDYCPNGRELRNQTTIGENKKANIQLNANTSQAQFVAWRKERDEELAPPELLQISIKMNINCGIMPH